MANRAMAVKVDRAKSQAIAALQAEMLKPAYLVPKAEVPAYDPAMVKRCEPVKRERKTVYRKAPAATLVKTGITVGSWDDVGTCRLIPRHR